jgi:hypothetical protein
MNHSHTFYHPKISGDELVFVVPVVFIIEKSTKINHGASVLAKLELTIIISEKQVSIWLFGRLFVFLPTHNRY